MRRGGPSKEPGKRTLGTVRWSIRFVRWSRSGGKAARERRAADDRHTVVPAQRRDCYIQPWAVWRRVGAAPRRSPSDEGSPPRSFRSTPLELGRFSGRLDLMHWKLSWRRWHTVSTTLPPGSPTGHAHQSASAEALGRLRGRQHAEASTPCANQSRAAILAAMSAGRSRCGHGVDACGPGLPLRDRRAAATSLDGWARAAAQWQQSDVGSCSRRTVRRRADPALTASALGV